MMIICFLSLLMFIVVKLFEPTKMGTRMKEDERIEKVIRSLLKLPENRRCINCNSLGPQYVCTTFWTFVCTNCSGIQREFNHRVKSVSMAKFTAEEVSTLQACGNERAKQIYFKEWDPQRHSYPDSNNIYRLREFIKHVYVDRKFTGERSHANLPRLRLNDKEVSSERRKNNANCIGSKSPLFEDKNEARYGERSSSSLRTEGGSFKYYYDERRSPRYASRHGGRRTPIKLEVVDDRFREHEFRSRRLSNLESKKVAAASGEGSVEGNSAEKHITSQVSEAAAAPETQSNASEYWAPFDDFRAEEAIQTPTTNNLQSPSKAEKAPQTPTTNTLKSSSKAEKAPQTPTTNTLKSPSKAEKAPQTPTTNTLKSSTPQTTTANAIEFLLSELSGPLVATTGGISEVYSANNDPSTATIENMSAGGDLPPTSVDRITSSPNTGASSVTSTTDNPRAVCSSTTKMMSPPVRAVSSNNQPTVSPNKQDLLSAFTELSSQDTRSDVGSQPCTVETKSSGRKELPVDLFTTNYLSGPAPLAGWQNVQPHDMGFGMQYYPNTAPPSAFPAAAKYRNPFDVTVGRTQVHASPFPTTASLQSVRPAMSTGTGLVRASSLGSLGSMVPQSPSYASPIPPQSPFASGFPPGAYFEQVNDDMQPSRPRRVGSFNSDRTVQRAAMGFMAPSTSNSFSNKGGNPFG